MKTRTTTFRTNFWKILCPLLIGCFTLAVTPALAQQDGGSGYGGQQGQQSQQDQYGQDQGQQGQSQGQYGQDQGQQGQSQGQYGQQTRQKADFEDETIEKFAETHKDVQDLQSDYSSELQEASDENQARDLQSKYREKILDVIEKNDLDVEKYNEISMAMQRDSNLREKIEDMM